MSRSRMTAPIKESEPYPQRTIELVQGHCHVSVHVHSEARENDHQHHGTCCRPDDFQPRGKNEDETVELSIEPAPCKYLFKSKSLI